MNPLSQAMIDALPNEVADATMVQHVARAMLAKLADKRAAGKGGWFGSTASAEGIARGLIEHIGKGDPVDIANFAGMLLARRDLYGDTVNLAELLTPAAAAVDDPPATSINLAGGGVQLIKISSKGKNLRDDAKEWDAVLDECTGLTFPAELPSTTHTWKDAFKTAKALRVAGYKDWRLATRKEALSITDDTICDPAFNQKYFRYPKSGWAWTASACAWYQSHAWVVVLGGGNSYVAPQGNKGLVLAVRGPVASPGQ